MPSIDLRTTAVLNQKGGVGKTTVTLGLASAAMSAGARVLVVDLDPQASSSWVLGIEPDGVVVSVGDVLAAPADSGALVESVLVSTWSDLVDVVPARPDQQEHEDGASTRLADAFRSCAPHLDDYDVVLVDCPPSLGNLTTNALAAARHALVVVEPSALGLRGIGGVADRIESVWESDNPDLDLAGVLLNRVPAVSAEADRRIAELKRTVGSSSIWKPAIPQRVIFNEAVGERRPIHSYGSRAADPVEVFDTLWRKLRRTITAGVKAAS